MAFTDRFIKLPVRVVDTRLQELTNGNNSEEEDSYIKINPFDIVKYRPSWDKDDADKEEIICIVDRTGETTLVYLSMEEFEKLLNRTDA